MTVNQQHYRRLFGRTSPCPRARAGTHATVASHAARENRPESGFKWGAKHREHSRAASSELSRTLTCLFTVSCWDCCAVRCGAVRVQHETRNPPRSCPRPPSATARWSPLPLWTTAPACTSRSSCPEIWDIQTNTKRQDDLVGGKTQGDRRTSGSSNNSKQIQ